NRGMPAGVGAENALHRQSDGHKQKPRIGKERWLCACGNAQLRAEKKAGSDDDEESENLEQAHDFLSSATHTQTEPVKRGEQDQHSNCSRRYSHGIAREESPSVFG